MFSLPRSLRRRREARDITGLAHAHDCYQIIVVSDTPQTTRTQIRFDRCYHGHLLFGPFSPGGLGSWFHNVIYEVGSARQSTDTPTRLLTRRSTARRRR
jgi:hypothetical protein